MPIIHRRQCPLIGWFGGGVKLDDATITINTGVRQSQPAVDAKGNPVGWTGTAISLVVATPFHVYAVCG